MNGIKNKAILCACGCLVGIVNGIFGGGGGMIVVPLLTGVCKKPPLVAHATAILIILPVCLASAMIYIFSGQFDTELFLSVSIGVLLGGAAGAKILNRISPSAAVALFAIVMFAAGIKMIF